MSDYSYSHDNQTNKFKFYINHHLIYSFDDCDPMTEKEAENLAEDLWVEWKENKQFDI